MSLLMDALRKAEQGKRRSEESTDVSSPASLPPLGSGAITAQPSLTLTDSPAVQTLDLAPLPVDLPPLATSAEPAAASPGKVAFPDLTQPATPEPPTRPALELINELRSLAATAPAPAPATPPPPRDEPQKRPEPAARKADAAHTPAATPSSRPATDQTDVNNLFAVKNPPSPRKRLAVLVGAIVVVGTAAIGGYVWWQLQPRSSLLVAAPSAAASKPVAPAAPTPTPPAPQSTVTPPPAPAAPVTPPESVASVKPPTPEAAPRELPAKKAANDDTPSERPTPRKLTEANAEPQSPIRVVRKPLRMEPTVSQAYEAFQRGELTLAKSGYEQALRNDPNNADALHGLAAIAIRQRELALAESYFERILTANPQDAVAQSSLINLRAQSNPTGAESRLKLLATQQPEQAATHFALGNLYAAQEQWHDAQQAYFKAYALTPGNPDVLFNLAISLEHLRQPKLAAKYYGLALQAAQQAPAGFDSAQAKSRLQALQP